MKAGVSATTGRANTANVNTQLITNIVDGWITTYEKSRSDGLQQIIQFIIHSAGCKGIADKSLYESQGAGFSTLIQRMIEQFDEDSSDYPFIINTVPYRRFRSSFGEFISILVKQTQRDIIYDAYLMDNVIQLLTEMAGIKVRAFRHTAAIASMKFMTAFVKVAFTLHGNLNQTTRQLDNEKQKSARARATEKIKALTNRQKELEEQSGEIEDMLNSIFKGIFVFRYRDMEC